LACNLPYRVDSVESITKDFSMSEQIEHNRRRFLGTAAMTLAANQLGMFRSADAESRKAELLFTCDSRVTGCAVAVPPKPLSY